MGTFVIFFSGYLFPIMLCVNFFSLFSLPSLFVVYAHQNYYFFFFLYTFLLVSPFNGWVVGFSSHE